MNTSAISNKNNILSIIAVLFMGLSVFLGLAGCGGGDGGAPVVDAAPVGFYNAGGATIKDPDNPVNDRVLTDLQAMVSGNRIMIMSNSAVLLYDATITDITGNSFTASALIYYGMDSDPNDVTSTFPTPIATTLTGTITEGSQLTGTIEGTGTGTFTLTLTHSLNAPLADSANFIAPTDLVFEDCLTNGTITPVVNESVFAVSIDLSTCAVGTPERAGTYTGFATTKDSNHDTLIVMFSNGEVSAVGELLIVDPKILLLFSGKISMG